MRSFVKKPIELGFQSCFYRLIAISLRGDKHSTVIFRRLEWLGHLTPLAFTHYVCDGKGVVLCVTPLLQAGRIALDGFLGGRNMCQTTSSP